MSAVLARKSTISWDGWDVELDFWMALLEPPQAGDQPSAREGRLDGDRELDHGRLADVRGGHRHTIEQVVNARR